MSRSVYLSLLCSSLIASLFLLAEVIKGEPQPAPRACQYQTPLVQRDLKVPGWQDRDYDIYLPQTYDCDSGADLVVAFHGGFGNKKSLSTVTCPDGRAENPECFQNLATQSGFIVVMPNGSRQRRWNPRHRSFNAGGGTKNWNCVGGPNCDKNIDDISYFKALLETVRRLNRVRNVFLTGISDGAALSHRIACEVPSLVRAIAPVAGENQFLTTKGTSCSHAEVSVLDIHGDADPCWKYEGGPGRCGTEGNYVSVPNSINFWVTANGCGEKPEVTRLPATTKDGIGVERYSYPQCKNGTRVEVYRVEGGGHTWPGGDQYAPKWLVGATTRNFEASRTMLKFFRDTALQSQNGH